MKMKQAAVDAAVTDMIDAGLDLHRSEATRRIWEIYDREGIEFQEVFDKFLIEHYGKIDHKILASGIIAYRRAREAALVLYPPLSPIGGRAKPLWCFIPTLRLR